MTNKPHALANLGATCYINTAIQCLGYCKPFRDFILNRNFANVDVNGKTIQELYEIYDELFNKRHSIIPRKFINALRKTITSIDIHEQNDINEFIIIFLDRLNTDIAYKYDFDINSISRTFDQMGHLKYNMDKAWNTQVSKEYSALIPMFYGQHISQISCGNCIKIHHNYEIFSELSLPIDDSTNTLYDCFDKHFKDEVLNSSEKDDPWKCDKCNKTYKSDKCVLMWKTPEILIISLKRFDALSMRKNPKSIDVPNILDITKYTINKNNCKYRLCSAAIHMGYSQLGGHYYAICKDNSGNWWRIDDLDVKQLADNKEVSQGYILFYTEIRD